MSCLKFSLQQQQTATFSVPASDFLYSSLKFWYHDDSRHGSILPLSALCHFNQANFFYSMSQSDSLLPSFAAPPTGSHVILHRGQLSTAVLICCCGSLLRCDVVQSDFNANIRYCWGKCRSVFFFFIVIKLITRTVK